MPAEAGIQGPGGALYAEAPTPSVNLLGEASTLRNSPPVGAASSRPRRRASSGLAGHSSREASTPSVNLPGEASIPCRQPLRGGRHSLPSCPRKETFEAWRRWRASSGLAGHSSREGTLLARHPAVNPFGEAATAYRHARGRRRNSSGLGRQRGGDGSGGIPHPPSTSLCEASIHCRGFPLRGEAAKVSLPSCPRSTSGGHPPVGDNLWRGWLAFHTLPGRNSRCPREADACAGNGCAKVWRRRAHQWSAREGRLPPYSVNPLARPPRPWIRHASCAGMARPPQPTVHAPRGDLCEGYSPCGRQRGGDGIPSGEPNQTFPPARE